MVTVQNTPRSLQQSCCRSRKQEDSNLPRGEVMGLGNSQIMKRIFLKRQLIYRPRSLPLSFPRQENDKYGNTRGWLCGTKDRFTWVSKGWLRAPYWEPGLRHSAICVSCSHGDTLYKLQWILSAVIYPI